MKKLNYLIYSLIFIFINGCIGYEGIYTKDELQHKLRKDEISLVTKDTTIYYLQNIVLGDSTITGTGKSEKNGTSTQFHGKINLSDIRYIQSEDVSFWKSVAAVGVVGFLGIAAVSIAGDSREGVNVKIVHPSSGGSCPYIYSKNKSGYSLEGEAIPVSLGKALETETTNSLLNIEAENNSLDIRITNERPETHYINSVRLFRYESTISNNLVADAEKNVWPVINPLPPSYAEDYSRKDITADIETDDNNYWESDLSTAFPAGKFTDGIIIAFPNEKSGNSSLIIKAVNTRISDVLFRKIYDFLGKDILRFVYALENDKEIISSLKNWIKEVSLKAYVWNGSEWEYAGLIYPEATRIPFKKLIRINFDNIRTQSLKIKLEFMTDVWKIDAVSMDFSEVEQIKGEQVPLVSATLSGEEISNKITSSDNYYSVLLPGDKIDLKFYDEYFSSDTRYFVNISGYLYEWYVKDSGSNSDFLTSKSAGPSRFELFKLILNNKNLLLPPIYSEWEKLRKTL